MTTYHTAKTITAIATGTDRDIRVIKDRTTTITQALVDRLLARSQCHFAGRRPKAPGTTPTDMDLASYLLALYRRQAVVSIDGYQRLTPRSDQTDVRHIGDTRFGTITGLVSHQEYLSFGVRLQDASVIGGDGYTEQVGQARSFTLLAPNGDWHAGPTSLGWRERADEATFNQHHQLSLPDIQSLAHRNRAESVTGSPYLAAKALLLRLDDEIEHFRRPTSADCAATTRSYNDVASEIVPSFTMQLHGVELVGEYPSDICGRTHLSHLYQWRQIVQWLVRINEYAFFVHGMQSDYVGHWVRGTSWQHTGQGQAHLELHPKLQLSYQLRYVSRMAVAKRVPLSAVREA